MIKMSPKHKLFIAFTPIISILGTILIIFFFTSKPIIAKNKTFRIITEEFPPYNYTKDGKISGISTEIVREILKRLKQPDNIKVMPWVDGYKLVLEEDNVILYSTTRSPIREKLFKWVGPLVPNNTMFFARKGSGINIKSIEDAKKISKIGVYKDDFGELLLKKKGFTNLESVVDNRENIKKLINGEIDLWIINKLTGDHMIRDANMEGKIESIYEVQKDFMSLAFSKNTSDSVIEAWQKALDDIKADGTYGQIFSRWIMFSYTKELKPKKLQAEIKLTEKEKKWLKAHPVITVAPDPDFAPIESFDANGNFVGIAADFIALVEKKLGIRFKILRLKNWDEIVRKTKLGEIDIWSAAGKTTQRTEYMLFTKPYIEYPAVIIVGKGVEKSLTFNDLKNMKVAVVSNYTEHDYMKFKYPTIKLVTVPDTATGLRKVSLGIVDAMVASPQVAIHNIEKTGINNLRMIGKTGFIYKFSIASGRDEPMLKQILEKGLEQITSEEKQAIKNKWLHLKAQSIIPHWVWYISLAGLGVVGFVITTILAWNRSLKKKVQQRTVELDKELEVRLKAEKELEEYQVHLEKIVDKRTTKLTETVDELQKEIAERKQAEKALQESEKRINAIFQAMPIPMIASRMDTGIVIYANLSFATTFGYTMDELVGKKSPDLYYDPKDRKKMLGALKKTGSLYSYELRSKKKDGTQFWVLLSVLPIVLGDEKALIAGVYDITERKQAEEALELKNDELENAFKQLKEAQTQIILQEKMASLGSLTAGIAHEIKNPLNFINNFSKFSIELTEEIRELIDKHKLNDGFYDEAKTILDDLGTYTQKINEHGIRADSIVKSMLMHSRGQSGERLLTDINYLLKEYVNLVFHGMRAQDSSFNITIDENYDSQVNKIKIIQQDMSRVFLNILNNACYAADQRKKSSNGEFSPTLTVSTKNLDAKVEIRIRDNGMGIDKSIQDKIFNPFFTTKPTGSGTGLGLSISYDIVVQEHKGELSVESKEGEFTEFLITLPK